MKILIPSSDVDNTSTKKKRNVRAVKVASKENARVMKVKRINGRRIMDNKSID